jgi:hypothetical protein
MTTITIDDSLFGQIKSYYEQERGDVESVKTHVVQYCTLDSAFGLLLSQYKPGYDRARSEALSALDGIHGTLQALAEQTDGYHLDVTRHESDTQKTIATLQAQVAELMARPSGGGGGGGGGVPSIAPTPAPAPAPAPAVSPDPQGTTPPSTAPGTPAIDITVTGNEPVTINIDGNGAPGATPGAGGEPVTINIDGNGTPSATPVTDSPAAMPVDGSAAPLPTQVGVTASPTLPTGSGPTPLTDNSLVDQFWQQKAAHDPLGRSVGELEAAWLAREPIQFDGSAIGLTTLGLGEGVASVSSVDFSLDADAAAGGATAVRS